MQRLNLRHALCLGCLSLLIPGVAASELRLLPGEFVLHGPEGRQQLTLAQVRDGELSARVEDDAVELTSNDPEIVSIEDGVAVAQGDGTTEIVARRGEAIVATSTVSVAGYEAPHRWSFRNHIQSVFSKVGCNSGACHGALAGKSGFKLSLRGYDPQADFLAVTREARGRRIEIADPGRSLILAKPTGALPHKGGLKLDVESRDYRILAEWIAGGASGPEASDPRLETITVVPAAARLAPGETSQVLVQAHYDDGRTVDVTDWARFTATDEAVASVDPEGLVTVRGSGEAAIRVWFGSKIALARITSPYPHEVEANVYAEAPRRNFIDDLNLTQLKTLQLEPSPRADDETFLRRATIDTIGRLPTAEERAAYLADPEAERRDLLIDRLIGSEDYVDYWAYRLSDILVISGARLRPVGVKTYYQWVHDSVRENKPWDQFVREIMTAVGESNESGPTNFYALNQSPEEMTENACQAFLGLSIGCAKCHNHPLEKWTNDQYYAMANLFARVRAKGWGGEGSSGDGLRTLYVATHGDLIQPSKGKPQPPAPLDGEPLSFDDPRDRREKLAQWMTAPDNPYFARAIANRIWGNFFGRGLVEPADDMRLSNPATNEPLLAAAAQYLVDADFDLQQLVRAILRSETYQRSSVPLATNRDEDKYHSRYYPRRLMAEVFLDSIDQVLGTSTAFDQLALPGAEKKETDFYEKGTRAIELYDAAVDSYFLSTFGRNPREIVCECERTSEPSMVQVLHLANGDTLNTKLSSEDNRIGQWVNEGLDDAEIVKRLFSAALSRPPTTEELGRMLVVIAEYGEQRRTGLEDAAWAVLTSPEFTFNH